MKELPFGNSKREIAELLRSKGINPTAQRIEIGYFLRKKPQHLSAEEIYQAINQDYEQVSQATVYNTLRLFVEKNFVSELIFSPDRIYYDTNLAAHHHFVDEETGQIMDVLGGDFCPEKLLCFPAQVSNVSLVMRGRILNPGAV